MNRNPSLLCALYLDNLLAAVCRGRWMAGGDAITALLMRRAPKAAVVTIREFDDGGAVSALLGAGRCTRLG